MILSFFEYKSYKPYKIGDIVIYKNNYYYVIENSNEFKENITLLKVVPLTTQEVNNYGTGYINKYTTSPKGYVNNKLIYDVCLLGYDTSDFKHIVDLWTSKETNVDDLVSDTLGQNARLITVKKLMNNLGYNNDYQIKDTVLPWIYNIIHYSTMRA